MSVFCLVLICVVKEVGMVYLDWVRKIFGEECLGDRDGRVIEYFVMGEGFLVFLIVSVGWEVSDFNELVSELVGVGFCIIVVEFLGIGKFVLFEDCSFDLFDFVVDMVFIGESEGDFEFVFVVGYVFGNWVVCVFVIKYLEWIKVLVLIVVGGVKLILGKVVEVFFVCFDGSFLFEVYFE